MTLPSPRREVEKSWLTLLLRRGLMWSVTEPTQETHWTCALFFPLLEEWLGFPETDSQMCPDCERTWRYCPPVRVSSQSSLLHLEGHQLFCSARFTSSTLAKKSWPRTRNQGTYHLQKICILLSQGEKMILCPQTFKMLCCGSNKLGWDSGVRALCSVLRGGDTAVKPLGMWKAHQNLANYIPSRGKEVCSSPTTS